MADNEQTETPSGAAPPGGGTGPATPNPFEWGHYGSGQVHLFGLLFCIGSIVLLTRLSSLLSPFNLYFTFSDLITSSRETLNPFPFLIKAGIPFLTADKRIILASSTGRSSCANRRRALACRRVRRRRRERRRRGHRGDAAPCRSTAPTTLPCDRRTPL